MNYNRESFDVGSSPSRGLLRALSAVVAVMGSGDYGRCRLATYGQSDIVLDEPVRFWPRGEIDLSRDYMTMALAEAGYPVEWTWSTADEQYEMTEWKPIPYEVMERARRLTLDRLGRGYAAKESVASGGDADA